MKLKKSKLFNIILMTLGLCLLSMTISSCTSGSSANSNQVTSNVTKVILSSDFVTTNPIKANQNYVLSVTDSNGEVLSSQIFECADLNQCIVNLENLNSAKTGFVFIRIFNGNGGLVAASLLNKARFVNGDELNSTEISFSEYSTGVYILAKMQQISDVMYNQHNDDVVADFKERFHLQNVAQADKVIPMVTYQLANQLGLDEGEASGIFRLWYNIYGDADDYDGVSASMINKSTAYMYASNSMATKSSKGPSATNLPSVVEVDELDEDDTKSSKGLSALQNANKKLLEEINRLKNNNTVDTGRIIEAKDLQTTKGAQQKAGEAIPEKRGDKKDFSWVSATEASGVVKRLAQLVGKDRAPVTAEERATAEIISNVFGIVSKAISSAAPGLGTVFGMLNTFALDAFFPVKGSNPNAALEAKIGVLNDSVVRLNDSLNNRMDQQDQQTLANIQNTREKLLSKGNGFVTTYFSYLKTGRNNISEENANIIIVKNGYPAFLDSYIQVSSDSKQAINNVKALFGNQTRAEEFVQTAKDIASDKDIKVFMTALNNVRNNMRDSVKKGTSNLDYVAIDEIYYSQILKASTDTMDVLEKMRNYQLAGAYLLRNSRYKDEIGNVYISEDMGDNLESYTQMVTAINNTYDKYERSAMETFKATTQKSTIYQEVKPWASGIVQENDGDTTKSCVISYWNGTDLGIVCEKKGIRGSNISTKIYDILNICQDKLVLDGTRVYCKVKPNNDDTSGNGQNAEYVEASKFMAATNYVKDTNCSFLVFGCDTKEYNKLFVFDDLNNEGLKNNNGIEYVGSVNRHLWGSATDVHEFRITLKKNGNLDSGRGLGSSYTIGKPITDRYVTYNNHKAWVLSSYNTFTTYGDGPMSGSYSDYTTTFTLGCLTSDCILYKKDNVTELYYPDLDYYFTMEVVNPKDDKSYVKLGKKPIAKDSAGLPKIPLPLGDWVTQCNLDNNMTYNNGVLSAMCTNGAWSSDKPEFPSILNYKKSCAFASYVTVEINKDSKKPVLKCVNAKKKDKE